MKVPRIGRSTFLPLLIAASLAAYSSALRGQAAPVPPVPPSASTPVTTPSAPMPPETPAPPAPVSPQKPEGAETHAAASGDTITPPGSTSPRNWTTDQILTATVHQAWILAGKDETNFFEIVRELAEISAQNRNLKLPDTPEAGKKAGAYIRAQAKEDHDQLLYDIVDKAVRMTGTKGSAAEATDRPAAHPGN